jgi:hypothetical protein
MTRQTDDPAEERAKSGMSKIGIKNHANTTNVPNIL